MNYLTYDELDDLLVKIQTALHIRTQVEITYWYRCASYEVFESWGIDKEKIEEVLQTVSSVDVVKSELQHGNKKGLVLTFFVWLLPIIHIDQFAYLKVALEFDTRYEIKSITILSFKEACENDTLLVLDYFDGHNYFEWNRSTWLKVNPEFILSMNPQNCTPFLLEQVLLQAPELSHSLPKNLLTPTLVNAVCRQEPTHIFCFPICFFEVWRLLPALHEQPEAIQDIPHSKLTQELVQEIVVHHPHVLPFVPIEYWNEKMMKQAIRHDPTVIASFPQHSLTLSLVDLACQLEPTLIFQLPHRFWRPHYVREAVMIQPMGLMYADECDITDEIAHLAFNRDVRVIQWLPKHYCTETLIVQAVEVYPQAASYFSGKWHRAFATTLLEKNPEIIKYIPMGILSVQQYHTLLQSYPQYIAYVPKSALTQVVVNDIIQTNPELLACIPKDFKHSKLCLQAVQADEQLWQYVPKHIKERLMFIYR